MGTATPSESMDSESTSTQGESVTSGSTTNLQKVSVWDLPDVPQGKLPPHLELKRTRVLCDFLAPTNTENVNYSGAYASVGVDNSVRFEQFRNNFKVEIVRLEEDELEFDMIGIDPSLANAFRRILIAELPTMAIEKVLIANNTSIIQDEVLAHRLGLIPIKVDPRLFEYMSENDVPNEKNTVVFKLHARCKKGSERLRVLSSELKWLPNGSELILATESPASKSSAKPKTYTSFSCSQDTRPEFSNDPIAPKDADIIIAKLGPGQ
ncbi:DNA-directed RNA polymerase protein, partial [Datura stramonium]|nr:DNA-directed RNA polymerase protein [Datura stramonium]